MVTEVDVDAELERANRYFSIGSFRRANSVFRDVLSREPDHERALVGEARADAELGRVSFDDALATIERLAALHPDNVRIRGSLVSILRRMGRIDESVEELTKLFEQFPESPIVLQLWANVLQVDSRGKVSADTQTEAWVFYQRAMQSGPLSSPCFKSAAYYAGRRADPAHAKDALRGSGLVERLALRSRGLGARYLLMVFLFGVALAFATYFKLFHISLGVQVLTLGWGVWCVYANNLMCCKKCRNRWIALVGYFTAIGAGADHPSTWNIAFVVALAFALWTVLMGRLSTAWRTAKTSENEAALT